MRFLTGLQPSGQLHIGNYFGAIEPAVRLQEKGEAFYFIANYHAMTTMESAGKLRENTRGLAVDFLACGLDPEKAVFFAQSAVPEVNELAWILSTLCPMGLLERCHSYKDKVAKGFAASHALFAYPALMAADILLYDSDAVPVGKDQKQHLEVTRDLAGKINDTFGEGLLKMPEAIISEATAVVPGLDGQKMSKSYGNTLPIFGEEKPLRKPLWLPVARVIYAAAVAAVVYCLLPADGVQNVAVSNDFLDIIAQYDNNFLCIDDNGTPGDILRCYVEQRKGKNSIIKQLKSQAYEIYR